MPQYMYNIIESVLYLYFKLVSNKKRERRSCRKCEMIAVLATRSTTMSSAKNNKQQKTSPTYSIAPNLINFHTATLRFVPLESGLCSSKYCNVNKPGLWPTETMFARRSVVSSRDKPQWSWRWWKDRRWPLLAPKKAGAASASLVASAAVGGAAGGAVLGAPGASSPARAAPTWPIRGPPPWPRSAPPDATASPRHRLERNFDSCPTRMRETLPPRPTCAS